MTAQQTAAGPRTSVSVSSLSVGQQYTVRGVKQYSYPILRKNARFNVKPRTTGKQGLLHADPNVYIGSVPNTLPAVIIFIIDHIVPCLQWGACGQYTNPCLMTVVRNGVIARGMKTWLKQWWRTCAHNFAVNAAKSAKTTLSRTCSDFIFTSNRVRSCSSHELHRRQRRGGTGFVCCWTSDERTNVRTNQP